MLRVIADTHALIWYLYGDMRLSLAARKLMDAAVADADQIGFSSISFVEVVYLAEKGRIRSETFARLLAAVAREDATFVELPVDRFIAQALSQIERGQIPDMPDRIIAATALHLGLPLISRDGKIRISDVETVW